MANINYDGLTTGNFPMPVNAGDTVTVTNFGIFGTDPLNPVNPGELDTLVFISKGMTAANMILTQNGADVVITFDGDTSGTSVTLVGVDIEQLENITNAGNFRFYGESKVKDNVDIWDKTQTTGIVGIANGATFLNDLNNQIQGKDKSNDTINGQGGSDSIAGLSGNDILRGGMGDDRLSGDDGNDSLDGGSGIDRMAGGKGNDIYIVDNSADGVLETEDAKAGGGIDLVKAGVDYKLGANVENLLLTGSGNFVGRGNGLANALTGNNGDNMLFGYAGKDNLAGGAGNDVLDGGAGDDILTGGAGNDDYYVDSLKDKIVESLTIANGGDIGDRIFSTISYSLKSLANIENLTLLGGADLQGTGNAAKNTILGNSGNNLLDGGAGMDLLVGLAGSDTYVFDDAGDRAEESAQGGTDTVILAAAALNTAFAKIDDLDAPGGDTGEIENVTYKGNLGWNFVGNAKNNVLIGGTGSNALDGDVGDDRLIGNAKADTLTGGDGNDILDGGAGSDILKGGGNTPGDNGNDTYIIDSLGDSVDEGADTSQDDIVRASISIDLNQGGFVGIDRFILTGKAKLNLTGGAGNDDFIGNGGDNILTGNDGDDSLDGGAGSDILKGGNGSDDLYGGAGIDRAIFSGKRSDYLIQSQGQGVITVTDINNSDGDEGTDTLTGIEILKFELDGKVLSAPTKITDADSSPTIQLKAGFVPLAGQPIGITAKAIDSDNGNNPFTYSLVDNAGGRFTIDSVTGVVSTVYGPLFDHEVQSSRTIVVRATDADGLSVDQKFTIKITPNPHDPLDFIDLGAIPAARGFRIEGDGGDNLGQVVAGIGDFDSDGFDDIAIGASNAATGNNEYYGKAYVLLGKSGGFGSKISAANITGKTGFAISGDYSVYEHAGESLAGAGDINGDGFADLLSGDPSFNGYSGRAHLIFGGAGGFGAGLPLGALDGKAGFALSHSGNQFDFMGRSLGTLGDINGDGFDDFFVSSFNASIGAKIYSGSGYVVFGKQDWSAIPNLSLASLSGSDGFAIEGGAAGDRAEIRAGGDLNGDGFADIVIGAYGVDIGGISNYGSVYVIYGKAGGFSAQIDLANALPASDGFRIDGRHQNDNLGKTLAVGDINGDGLDDLLMSMISENNNASPRSVAYIVFGQTGSFGATFDLNTIDGKNGVAIGAPPNREIGPILAFAGDINGDGFGDFLVGDYGGRYAGSNAMSQPIQTNIGSTYLIYGKANWSANNGQIDLLQLTADQGFRIDGAASDDQSGASVGAAGDLNGDGFDDLVIGAPNADSGGNGDSGAAYILYGGNFTRQLGKAGSAKADNIKGTVALESLLGGAGNDSIMGGGGADYLAGGAGNDSLIPGDATFRRIDGGAGVDIARLDALSGRIDLTGAFKYHLDDIEILDLSGTKGNNLILDEFAALNLPGENGRYLAANTLFVTGDRTDAATLVGGWSDMGIVTDPQGALGEFHHYVKGNATLYIETDLAVLQADAQLPDSGARAFVGAQGGDLTGASVAGLGDLNGDGFADLLIGAPHASFNAQKGAGSGYVFFGGAERDYPRDGASLDGSQGFRLDGVNSLDYAGASVAAAGDVNRDGYDDLLIGAPGVAGGTGQSYLVFGKAGGFAGALDLASLGTADGFVLDGVNGLDYAGAAVAGAGDIDGDGYDDILIGAYGANNSAGAAYVVLGGPGLGGSTINLGTGAIAIAGLAMGDQLGFALAGAGDFNSDGFADFLIGAPRPGGFGSAYLIYGEAGWDGQSLNGVQFYSASNLDLVGSAVAGAGDVNGDGFDDILIGAPDGDGGQTDSGTAYLVFGKSGGFIFGQATLPSDGIAGVLLKGAASSDLLGASLSSAGDFNGDGFADFILGAPGRNGNAGSAYVVFGKADWSATPSLDLGQLAPADGFRLDGVNSFEYAGVAVAAAGDLDGDGFDDLAIGAKGASTAYILYGGNFALTATKLGGLGSDSMTGTTAADAFFGGAGKDILIGKGGADNLDGGAGDDTIVVADLAFHRLDGGGGNDILKFDFAGAIDINAAVVDRIGEFETLSFDNGKANQVTLHLADLLDLDLDNRDLGGIAAFDDDLKIEGNKGDSLSLLLSDLWSAADTMTLPGYAVYSQGGFNLIVDKDITVNLI